MRQRNQSRRYDARCGLLLAGVVLLVAGCASVEPAPFSDFAQTLRTLRDGADAQAGADVAAERDRLIAQVKQNPGLIADLQLDFPSEFETTYGAFGDNGEPLFVKLKRFQQGLKALNDAMVAYADALVTLAGDDTLSQATFDQLTTDLNANAGSAAEALNVNLPPERRALLSTVAVRLFQAYLNKKRADRLARAIREVQPQVEAYASAAQDAVRILSIETRKVYADEGFEALATATPLDVEAILQLNENTEMTLDVLGSMFQSYGKLPLAHADLAKAVEREPRGLAGLLAFTDEATRLKGLVDSLAAQNRAAAQGGSN